MMGDMMGDKGKEEDMMPPAMEGGGE